MITLSPPLRLGKSKLGSVVVARIDERTQARAGSAAIGDIESEDIASIRIENASANLPDQAKPYDGNRLAGAHVGLMDALQRDTAERAESRLANVLEPFGQLRHEIAVHPIHFGMIGLPDHRNQVARKDIGHASPHGNDAPHSRVSHRHGLSELVECRLHSGDDPVC